MPTLTIDSPVAGIFPIESAVRISGDLVQLDGEPDEVEEIIARGVDRSEFSLIGKRPPRLVYRCYLPIFGGTSAATADAIRSFQGTLCTLTVQEVSGQGQETFSEVVCDSVIIEGITGKMLGAGAVAASNRTLVVVTSFAK